MKRLLALLTLLAFLSGCEVNGYGFKISEDGKSFVGTKTGMVIPINQALGTITTKYTDEELLKHLGEGKESLDRIKRYRDGTWTIEDVQGSLGTLVELYLKVK